MTVIRIEHPKQGWGIFLNASLIDGDYHDSDWFSRHQDMDCASVIKGFKYGIHFCAYKSIEEMERWLTIDEIALFISKGFEVLQLEVTDYIVETDQVLFTKESITDRKNLNTLFLQKSLEVQV